MRYRVLNLSRGNVRLGDRVERAQGWLARARGLLGRSGLQEGEGLHLVPCSAVHMMFMRFPIDVAFLDAGGRVVRAVAQLRPWRATRFYAAAQSALELPAGTLARSGTREGDLLSFEEGLPEPRPEAAAERPDER